MKEKPKRKFDREWTENIKKGQAAARARGVKFGRKLSRPYFNLDEARRLRGEGWTWRQIGLKFKAKPYTVKYRLEHLPK